VVSYKIVFEKWLTWESGKIKIDEFKVESSELMSLKNFIPILLGNVSFIAKLSKLLQHG